MDEKRFDLVVRARAEGASRRSVLKGLFGGLVGGAALTESRNASADLLLQEWILLDRLLREAGTPAQTT